MDPQVGKTIGAYRIVAEVGRGGMAIVYKAYQPSLDRDVALKVLPPQFTFDAEFLKRFQLEARAAAKLKHPNIVTIHDVGEQDGTFYIVEEFVQGTTLADLYAVQLGGTQRIPSAQIPGVRYYDQSYYPWLVVDKPK